MQASKSKSQVWVGGSSVVMYLLAVVLVVGVAALGVRSLGEGKPPAPPSASQEALAGTYRCSKVVLWVWGRDEATGVDGYRYYSLPDGAQIHFETEEGQGTLTLRGGNQ